jgi:hypothetical protein
MKKKKEKTVRRTKKIGVFDPGTDHIAQFVTTQEDSDKAFNDIIVKQLLHNITLIRDSLSLPDKNSQLRVLLNKKDAEVPDDVFFDMLKAGGHPILNLPFAQQKMARWAKEKYNVDGGVAWKAQYNLKEIGACLAFKGHKGGVDERFVAIYRDEIVSLLNTHGIGELRSVGHAKLKLKEIFGKILQKDKRLTKDMIDRQLKDITENIGAFFNNETELANHITANFFDITLATLKNYIKRVERFDKDSPPAYIFKK